MKLINPSELYHMVFYSQLQYSRYIKIYRSYFTWYSTPSCSIEGIFRYIGAISHGILLLAAVFKVYKDISELYHMVFYSQLQYSRYIQIYRSYFTWYSTLSCSIQGIYRYIGAISHGILLLAAVFKVYIDILELYHMVFYSQLQYLRYIQIYRSYITWYSTSSCSIQGIYNYILHQVFQKLHAFQTYTKNLKDFLLKIPLIKKWPDRFRRFDIYWIQKYKQVKYRE